MPVSEHVGEFIGGEPSPEQLRPVQSPPRMTDEEFAEAATRQALREAILAHARKLVDAVLDTPASGCAPSAYMMVQTFANFVTPIAMEYRVKAHERFVARLAKNAGTLG